MYGILNRIACLFLVACTLVSGGCQMAFVPEDLQAQTASGSQPNAIVIEDESELPPTYPGAHYELYLRAHGGIPPLHWKVESGAIPPGITLEDNGQLHGSP